MTDDWLPRDPLEDDCHIVWPLLFCVIGMVAVVGLALFVIFGARLV